MARIMEAFFVHDQRNAPKIDAAAQNAGGILAGRLQDQMTIDSREEFVEIDGVVHGIRRINSIGCVSNGTFAISHGIIFIGAVAALDHDAPNVQKTFAGGFGKSNGMRHECQSAEEGQEIMAQ